MKYLILKDSVFLWNKKDRALFYDSATFDYVLVEKTTDALNRFCNNLATSDNLNSIEIYKDELDLKTSELLDLLVIKKIARYSNDMDDCAIPPVLLLNGDLDCMDTVTGRDFISTKNLYDYIAHFTFFIDKERDCFRKEREYIIKEIQRNNPSFEYNVLTADRISSFKDVSNGSKLNETVILNSHIDKRRIYIHQKININYWGHLYAFPNGEIHPCPNKEPKSLLGWIWEPIIPMVAKELLENNAWRRVRDFYPCNECIFQWLCPSPKKKEREQGIVHMCEVL